MMSATSTPKLLVKRLSEFAQLPTRGSSLAAGYDLYCAHDTVIPAQGKVIAPTDISIAVPAGHYGRVAPRSGLAVKHHLIAVLVLLMPITVDPSVLSCSTFPRLITKLSVVIELLN
ncbi:unnamed protein product [Mucor hiemalis]